jgi:hypothetical protein
VIRFTAIDGTPVCEAELKDRYGVYLDNDSLIELARRDADRRVRFLSAIARRGTLLFSLANAIEIAGPQGDSAEAVRDLLDGIGPHWIPLELNPWKVAEREQQVGPERAPVSEAFMVAYFQRRAYDLSPEGSKVLDLSSAFFRLGAVLDWAQEERDTIRADAEKIDEALRVRLGELRQEFEKEPTSLDRAFPPIPYDPRWPAAFVFSHLMRTLVREARAFQFKEHDSFDLCHAVVAAGYGSVATLDKQWKRRIEELPRPNELAKIYYRRQVDDLVRLLKQLTA